MVSRAHVWVSGRVQGVFFRHSTRVEAASNRLNGWVRNMDDGRVEAVFEGDPQDVKRMVEWCQKGPDGAHITAVDVNWDEAPEHMSSFYIKR
jgi:acylphosphatase